MSWIVAIQLLLRIVNLIFDRVDDNKKREIIENDIIRKRLEDLAIKSGIAKAIDIRSSNLSDDDVDAILRGFYRAEGESGEYLK